MRNKNEYRNQSNQQDWNQRDQAYYDRNRDNQNRYQRYSYDPGNRSGQGWQSDDPLARGSNYESQGTSYDQYRNRQSENWNNDESWNNEVYSQSQDEYDRNYDQNRRENYQGNDWSRENANRNYGKYSGQENYGSAYGNRNKGERNWWDRTSDEVSSWFGDDDAERRRRLDKINGPHSGKGPRGYSRSDDRITEDINEKLYHDSHIDASDIEVKVAHGEVTLTGTVDSRHIKRRAEDLTESVAGVKNVQNQLRVNNTDDTTSSLYNKSASREGDQNNGRKKSSAL